jgi:hypothetical protein
MSLTNGSATVVEPNRLTITRLCWRWRIAHADFDSFISVDSFPRPCGGEGKNRVWLRADVERWEREARQRVIDTGPADFGEGIIIDSGFDELDLSGLPEFSLTDFSI